MNPSTDITRLIAQWQDGDKSAENALFNELYQKLRSLALNCLRTEQRDRPMGATTLVHEAYLRLHKTENIFVNNSNHFLALVGKVMRQIVIDQARAHKSAKRGGGVWPVEIEEALLASEAEADEILAVGLALESLERRCPRQAQIVELRYFAGFSEEESAAILNISVRTARRDWDIARTRLRMAIEGSAAAPGNAALSPHR